MEKMGRDGELMDFIAETIEKSLTGATDHKMPPESIQKVTNLLSGRDTLLGAGEIFEAFVRA